MFSAVQCPFTAIAQTLTKSSATVDVIRQASSWTKIQVCHLKLRERAAVEEVAILTVVIRPTYQSQGVEPKKIRVRVQRAPCRSGSVPAPRNKTLNWFTTLNRFKKRLRAVNFVFNLYSAVYASLKHSKLHCSSGGMQKFIRRISHTQREKTCCTEVVHYRKFRAILYNTRNLRQPDSG